MAYWAHSDPTGLPPDHPNAHWQPLGEHLANVSALAKSFAAAAAPQNPHFHDLAAWCGLLHDYGKYSDCFQQMILTGKGKCQHAIHGAALSYGGSGAGSMRASHVALCIAGHHAGLPDLGGSGNSLQERSKKFHVEASSLISAARADSPLLQAFLSAFPRPLERLNAAEFDLFTRMLFSCLVDADRLDTVGRPVSSEALEPGHRLQQLMTAVNEIAARTPEGAVKSARQRILDDCLSAAALPENLLSLSVPTGGGKTIAAMAFALRRAALNPDKYRRIIVVIPFLSIIEQNADVYARMFGSDAVLEHHSGSFDRLSVVDGHFVPKAVSEEQYQNPERKAAVENWDAPLVVTTSVRFFESLFSNRPSDLRRVHNIARSIVILDEVQVLPRNLLHPLLSVIQELASKWSCTFVLSTATKPAFEKGFSAPAKDPRWNPGTLREIVNAPAMLHSSLQRTAIEWRIAEPVDWPIVAQWLGSHGRCSAS